MTLNRLLFAVRLVLGAVFIFAAVSKLHDLRAFAEEIADYRMLSAALVPLFAAALPGVEIVCGVMLWRATWARASALLCSAMLSVFIVALTQALLRGIDLRCGCFGGAELATWGTVARDVVMLLGCLLVMWKPGMIKAPPAAASP
jgi:hypothetical protein